MSRGDRSSDAPGHEQELDHLIEALKRLQRLRSSKQVFALLLKAIGSDLPRQAIEVLTTLDDRTMPVAEVAKRARMDLGATSRQLRKLEQLGLVKKQPSVENRSVVLVAATARGLKLSRLVMSVQRRHLGRVLDDWNEGDRRRLATLLDRLVTDLQKTPYEPELDG